MNPTSSVSGLVRTFPWTLAVIALLGLLLMGGAVRAQIERAGPFDGNRAVWRMLDGNIVPLVVLLVIVLVLGLRLDARR